MLVDASCTAEAVARRLHRQAVLHQGNIVAGSLKPNQGRPGAVYLSFIYTDAGIRNDAGICCFHTDTKGIFVHCREL